MIRRVFKGVTPKPQLFFFRSLHHHLPLPRTIRQINLNISGNAPGVAVAKVWNTYCQAFIRSSSDFFRTNSDNGIVLIVTYCG